MVTLSPVGLAAAPVANQLAVLATFKERLCRPFCIDSSLQPQVTVNYTAGTPVLNGTTVFVPVTAVVTVVTPGCGCRAATQLFTEHFVVAFQGQTAVPTSVTITSVADDEEIQIPPTTHFVATVDDLTDILDYDS